MGKYESIQQDMADQYPNPEKYPQDLDSFVEPVPTTSDDGSLY